MTDLLHQAEQLKLARTLDVPAGQLGMLDALDALEVRALRERITHMLFDQHRALFQRLATAARLVPPRVNALLAEKVFGPLLAARMSGLLPAERAIKVAACLPTDFLAELCLSLDPRGVPELLRRMPIRTIVDVARVLLARGEYMTMARFVDALTDAAIKAVVAEAREDEALVRIAYYIESPERLDHLIALLPDERLRGTIACTTRGVRDLQQAGVSLLARVGARQKGRLGDAAVSLGDEVIRNLVGNIGREGGNSMLPVVFANMNAASRRKAEHLFNV